MKSREWSQLGTIKRKDVRDEQAIKTRNYMGGGRKIANCEIKLENLTSLSLCLSLYVSLSHSLSTI